MGATAGAEEEDQIAAVVRRILADHDAPELMCLGAPARGEVEPALWRALGGLGVLAAGLPEKVGGSELDSRQMVKLAETFGAAISPLPYVAAAVLPARLDAHLGSPAALAPLRQALRTGEGFAAIAWQGSLTQAFPGEASPSLGDDGVLSGPARLCIGWEDASVRIVVAQRPGGMAVAILEPDEFGVTGASYRQADTGGAYDILLDGVRPKTLAADGPLVAQAVSRAFDEACLCSAAYLNGLAAGVLARTLEHLRTRVQFGRPLGTFQTVRHQMVDLRIGLELAKASTFNAARLVDLGEAAASASISAAKARASINATTTCRAAIQLHGGLGFAEEAGLGVALRVAMQHAAWLGGPRHHRRRFARLSGIAA